MLPLAAELQELQLQRNVFFDAGYAALARALETNTASGARIISRRQALPDARPHGQLHHEPWMGSAPNSARTARVHQQYGALSPSTSPWVRYGP